MSFLVSDMGLVRRLHRSMIQYSEAYAEAKGALAADSSSELLSVGAGQARYFGPAEPLNSAVGLGLDGPVAAEQIEQVEAFYARLRAPAAFEVAPCADPSLLVQLSERGYRLEGVVQVWVRSLAESLPGAEVAVERCNSADCDEWAKVWIDAFELSPDLLPKGRALFGHRGAVPVWVRAEGRPVAAANMRVQQGVAWLFGAGTLPSYRGRGYQTALLRERLRLAQSLGCDVALIETAVASDSARNCERAGFRVLYTKLKLVK